MTGQLALGGVDTLPANRRADLSQWFTHPDVAARIVRWCGSIPCDRILEPSAGSGVFVRAARANWTQAEIVAHELDPEWAEWLAAETDATVVLGDYMAAPPPAERFDLCLTNPPYEGGQDVAFVRKAMDESKRVVALLRTATLCIKSAHEQLWSAPGWGVVGVAQPTGRWRFDGPVDGSARQDFCAVKMARGYDGPTTLEWWT